MWKRPSHVFAVMFVLVAMLLLPSAAAQVVVFDSYVTTAKISGDTITVEREVRLKNVGSSPVIPGELHFRLFERDGDDKLPLPVSSFGATSVRGQKLGTKITEKQFETDLSIQIWDPLLPGFHYEFNMSYELEFSPSGIFFHEITLPREETTIPIIHEEAQFLLDDKYHVTYAPDSIVSSLTGNTVIAWKGTDSGRVVEYSVLPLPKIGVRAVNLFWLVIIFLLLAVLVMSVLRQRSARSPPPSHRGGRGRHHAPPPGGYPPQYGQQPPPQQQQYPPRYGGGR